MPRIPWTKSNLESHKLCSFYQAVDADGEILSGDVDVAGVEEWEHAVRLKILEVLVVCELHFVTEIYHLLKILMVVYVVVYGILDASVEVDGQHALRSC